MEIMSTKQAGATLAGLLLALSLISAPFLSESSAQSAEVSVESIALDKTTIIEFENNSEQSIAEIRVWLPADAESKSFKSEDGWTGKKNSAGVIVFTTNAPIGPGEAVKFGLQTDKVKPRISWKALDESNGQVGIGISEPTDLTAPAKDPPETIDDPPPPEPVEKEAGAIFDVSTLRLIPDRPKVGDTIRVVGMSYAANEALDFYIDGRQTTSFETDSSGNFVITSEIPENLNPSRIDFSVRDSDGNQKVVSLRVGEREDREAPAEEVIPLTVKGLPDVMHRGDSLKISGTAQPGSTVTARIIDPEGNAVTSEPRDVDMEGRWDFETVVSHNAEYGEYGAVITDGTGTIERSWRIESSKTIEMEPTTLKFEPGEVMTFNGTAIPNETIEFVLENPQGVEIFSDIKQVGDSGHVEFAYQTEQSTQEGTYVLLARQGDSREVILAGLGELPKEHIVAKFDKPNYKKSEVATVNIDGPASATLALLVLDSSDRQQFADNQVVLQLDGKLEYELDLKNYTSGGYTLVLSRANTKISEEFSVGLDVGSGQIDVLTTKDVYQASDPILILGKTNPSVLIKIQLVDPSGVVVKEEKTFTDKKGRISDGSFRIPADAVAGDWMIRATSGSTFAETPLEVVATIQEGMVVNVEIETIGAADYLHYHVLGAKNTVKIKITDSEGEEIVQLSGRPNQDGKVEQLWPIPKDLPPGLYTINATDGTDSASEPFELR